MWRKLTLKAKITSSILLVQTVILCMGAVWLVEWSKAKRFEELKRRLDTQSDALESAATAHGGALGFDATNEAVHELNAASTIYFEVVQSQGALLARGGGADAAAIAQLRPYLLAGGERETVQMVELPSGLWLIQCVPLRRRDGDRTVLGTSILATNAQAMVEEGAVFARIVVLGSLALLVATGLGSGVVVSMSTRNMRAFAEQIRGLTPPLFVQQHRLVPQSLEEEILFASFAEMVQVVQSSAAAQRLFIAHASHELKTPIAAALSALEVTLMRPRSADYYAETCREVLVEMATLRRLSRALLDLAQLDLGADAGPQQSCDVVAVARVVCERWRKAAEERHIRLSLAVDLPAESASVLGAAEQWEAILGNLVDNAVKYGREQGIVVVQLRYVELKPGEAERLVISVRDNGRGMSAEQTAQLGQLFFRADSSRSGGDSFGLGFAYTKRLVERWGGSIAVKSALDHGTLVSINPGSAATGANS